MDAAPTMQVSPNEPTSTARERVEDSTVLASERANVKRWQSRISSAKEKYASDFAQMRTNMDFVASYQWDGQTKRNDRRYKTNFILRLVKQKVSTLYAKNPKIEFVRKKRLDFALWDEQSESLLHAMQTSAMSVMQGVPPPPEAMALLDDWQTGTHWRKLMDHYGTTLSILYEHQLDTQEPEYKAQAKDCVDRTCVCGVSYARISYCSYQAQSKDLAQSDEQPNEQDRLAHARDLLRQIDAGDVESNSAQVDTLRALITALGGQAVESDDQLDHLVFDFPPATTIIPDPRCRRIKGFVGAHWVCQEYLLPVEFVNAFFNIKIDNGTSSYAHYSEEGEKAVEGALDRSEVKEAMTCVWEVVDKDTKNRFFICDGYVDYLMRPEVLTQVGKVLWPWFPLVFNAVETEKGCKATIFPPSDVELGTPQQKEWNRTRNDLRGQRKANAAKYLYAKGEVDLDDVKKIANAEPNQTVGVQRPANGKLEDLVTALRTAPIDPAVYDTSQVKEDLLLATGAQEANIGPAQPNVTATNSTIAEQSRTNVAASNVDDLEEWLSAQAYYGGGLLARNMPSEQVKQVVGPGAVWPDVDKDIFANEIYLKTIAGSSGRPNQALEISKITQLAPLLIQAGANPRAVIREIAKRLDEQLDENELFPVMPPGGSGMSPPTGPMGQGQSSNQGQPSAPGTPQGRGQMMPGNVQPMQKGTAEVAA